MYNETFSDKLVRLIKNPKAEYWRVVPYIKSRLFYQRKIILEFFGNDLLSKPFPCHDELMKYINFKNGFFVEVGGNDGFFQDPTYYLEKFKNWNGIIVEPLPMYIDCQKNRPLSSVYNCALVSSDYSDNSVCMIDCNAMSLVKEIGGSGEWVKTGEEAQNIIAHEVIVPVKTLTCVLDDYFSTSNLREIDLLTLDVEGYELNVLEGLNLDLYLPNYILIEIHTEERKNKIENFFNKKYKLLSHLGLSDYLYVKC